MPTDPSRRPSRRPIGRAVRHVGALAAALALAFVAVPTAAAAPAAAPSATPAATPRVTGQACLPGQGVTVVVDFTPAGDAYATGKTGSELPGPIKIGCAVGAQADIADAGKAAGFTFDAPRGFLQEINGVAAEAPTGAPAGTSAYWGLYVSTTTGMPSGPAATSWQYANVGISGGPADAGTSVLFQVEEYPSSATRPFALPLDQVAGHQPGDGAAPPASYPASTDGSAVAAATWLGEQLKASGYLLSTAGATDYGATADAVIALAASGVGKDAISAAAQKLYHSGTAYVGAPDQAASKWGAVAKMALVLQIAGLDPTAFPAGTGTRNLISELRLAQNPDGSFGSTGLDTPFTHALALFALERTTGGAPAATVTWLEHQQCTTAGTNKGSYGFGGCGGADPDSTALAVQALLGAGVPASDPSVAAADAWLVSEQAKDGSLAGLSGPNTNSTGLAGQALLASGTGYRAAVSRAAGYIGSLQVTCQAVSSRDFPPADLGAIAYNGDDRTAATGHGIGAADLSTWVRATSQALLGLGLPAMPSVTAAGASDLPAPQTCPTPALTLGASTVAAGNPVTVTVTGLAPSTTVTVTLHSDPVRLGTLKADAAGRATGRFTVPAATTAGAHRIVVTGSGVDLAAPLTVTAAPVAPSSSTPTRSGSTTASVTPTTAGASAATTGATGGAAATSGRPPATGATPTGDELAATGVSASTPYLMAGGGAALLLGLALTLSARERRLAVGRHRG